LIQTNKKKESQLPKVDLAEGLTKVMVDLWVKEMELGTMTIKLKNKDAWVT
jgi:hypothetical protein